jgi:hypothetical protein
VTGGERLIVTSQETDAKVESGLKAKSYEELLAEVATNRSATNYCVQQATQAQRRLDEMLTQKSILEARHQALMEELQSREDA